MLKWVAKTENIPVINNQNYVFDMTNILSKPRWILILISGIVCREMSQQKRCDFYQHRTQTPQILVIEAWWCVYMRQCKQNSGIGTWSEEIILNSYIKFVDFAFDIPTWYSTWNMWGDSSGGILQKIIFTGVCGSGFLNGYPWLRKIWLKTYPWENFLIRSPFWRDFKEFWLKYPFVNGNFSKKKQQWFSPKMPIFRVFRQKFTLAKEFFAKNTPLAKESGLGPKIDPWERCRVDTTRSVIF